MVVIFFNAICTVSTNLINCFCFNCSHYWISVYLLPSGGQSFVDQCTGFILPQVTLRYSFPIILKWNWPCSVFLVSHSTVSQSQVFLSSYMQKTVDSSFLRVCSFTMSSSILKKMSLVGFTFLDAITF